MATSNVIAVDLKVVAQEPGTGRPIHEQWVELPGALGPSSVEQFVFTRVGDPLDVAMTRVDGVGETIGGWLFAPGTRLDRLIGATDDNAAVLDLIDPTTPLLVIPFVRFPDGHRRELYAHAVEANRAFACVVGDDQLDPEALAPEDRRGRLADESPWLVDTDQELLEVQVTGWLRRLIEEAATYLVLDLPATGRYVQFMTEDASHLVAEVVGDRHLDGYDALTRRERRALRDLGWSAPAEDGGNRTREWVTITPASADEAVRQAALLATMTLRRVFGPLRPHDVEVRTGRVELT